MHYGSFGEQHMNGQDDPMEVQREIEALQRVVARTSEYFDSLPMSLGSPTELTGVSSNMVDIFEIAPHENITRAMPAPYAAAGQEARLARYQNLLSKLAANDDLLADTVVDWAPRDDDTIEMQGGVPAIRVPAGEPLVGYFTDVARATA